MTMPPGPPNGQQPPPWQGGAPQGGAPHGGGQWGTQGPYGPPPQGPWQQGPYGTPPRGPGTGRIVLIVVGIVLGVALIFTVGTAAWVLLAPRKPTVGTPTAAPPISASPGAVADREPPHGTSRFGILVAGKAPEADLPHVIMWVDYQCPPCAQGYTTFGATVRDLVDEGLVTAEVRAAHFLDDSHKNDASSRAALAAAAADEAGRFDDYHAALLAGQKDGGFSDEELLGSVAAEAGITGDALDTFTKTYRSGSMSAWVESADEQFRTDGMTGVPVYLVAGQEVDRESMEAGTPLSSGDAMELITAAWEAGGRTNEG